MSNKPIITRPMTENEKLLHVLSEKAKITLADSCNLKVL